MITAQDIREKTFKKATIGGYDMAGVDEFLDELAEEITACAKENAALKSKMRVLAEKVEEYRQTEDSMRLALLSAQKMSTDIEKDARKKADEILAEAQQKADSITRSSKAGIEGEERKLAEAKKATQRFIEHMTAVCSKQMSFYQKLSDINLAAQETEEPVRKAAEPVAEPMQEEEPTRKFASSAPKKRSYDEFSFGED